MEPPKADDTDLYRLLFLFCRKIWGFAMEDKVTAVTDATLKKDVQLKSNGRTFVYKGNVDSKIEDVYKRQLNLLQ